jgi:enterochelin esterase family protein
MRLRTRILPGVAVIALLTANLEPAIAQRAPGGPGPSEFDAFYTLGPDSLPRESVPKGEVRGPFKLPRRCLVWSTAIGSTSRRHTTGRGKSV